MQTRHAKRPRRTREEWAKEVVRWRRSGLTAAAYAAENDLHEGTLAGWASKFGSRALHRAEARREQPRFVPVRVSDSSAEESKPAGLEVVLSNGRRIRVSERFDAELLAQVVTVLDGDRQC